MWYLLQILSLVYGWTHPLILEHFFVQIDTFKPSLPIRKLQNGMISEQISISENIRTCEIIKATAWDWKRPHVYIIGIFLGLQVLLSSC